MKTIKTSVICAVILTVLTSLSVQGQTVFASNLSQAADWTTAGWVGGSTTPFQIAGKFTTGVSAQAISSVSLAMRDASGTTSPTFSVRLFSDSSGQPGAVLATFSGATNPNVEAIYDFTLGSSYTVSANTSYWIVASAPGQSSNFDYFRWKALNSDTSSSSFGWVLGTQIGNSNNGGISWEEVGANEPIFAVGAVSAIPEPSTYAAIFGAAALGLAAWRRKSVVAKRAFKRPV